MAESAVNTSQMSRSARKRKAEKDPNVESTITKHKKRQKRRSSFMRGRSRKSLPPVNIECSEIHQKISTDLPEEKRFEELKLACFEYTMQKLRAEIPIFDSSSELQCKVRRAFEATLADVSKSGILGKACNKNSFQPNPANLEMEEVIIKIQSHIRRLEEEGEKWDRLLEDHADANTEAEKLSTSTTSETKVVTKAPDSLSMKQRKLLSELPDLAAISDWARNSAEQVTLQIDKIHQTAKQLNAFRNSMDAFLRGEMAQLAVDSFTGYQDITDPKALILKAGTTSISCSDGPESMDLGDSLSGNVEKDV